ncbi:MAG: glycine--tRNA ligase subunit beta [Firmicutes bacterium]|nr:glycine--tRNA ligase subunit beta [Bacillota bacterium]
MQDFLLELGFEELPARFVEGALGQLSEAITKRLNQARLQHGKVVHYSSPRRLAILIRDLQLQQEDLVEEIKGPPLTIARDESGNLTKAGQGFLRSQGVDESVVFVKSFQGADYLYVKKEIRGQKTATLLKPLLEESIASLGFPKNMRWGDYDLRFARPLRWILALLGSEVIPVEVGPVKAGQITFGHRQLSSGSIAINAPQDYCSTLKEHYVVVDSSERRTMIWQQIQALAKTEGAEVHQDEDLLSEIVNLVEYPTAFCGSFDAEYLEVPAEVLITSMKEHQRYFPLHDPAGKLLPKFLGVRNGADNHLDNVVRGNEKVLEARLADAKFFYDEDLKHRLEDNLESLERVVFQEKLGSMGEKIRRIERLTKQLVTILGHAENEDTALRVARLAKCDLVSQMVYEFPELQGVMGEKYALAQGEEVVVATGIREHYMPRFSGDALPSTVEGTVVSLADKLDTLAGYFAIGKIPTGSQDPFALRRQAQGVVQMLVQGQYAVPLRTLITLAGEGYQDVTLSEEHTEALVEFLLARLRVLLQEQGYSYDVLDAVMASGDDRIPHVLKKVQAISQFKEDEHFSDLMTGFERVANLAAKAEGGNLDLNAFAEADRVFHHSLEELNRGCQPLFEQGSYGEILQNLANFREAVDRFFNEVMIMDENPIVRTNRLLLLKQALNLYILCGDLRLIVSN